MGLGWLTVLKSVPWAGVISSAPLVADGARQLWKAVSRKQPTPAPTSQPPAHSGTTAAGSLERLEARVATLETGLEALHAQMLKSSELIKALADQNTLLIARVEAHRVRTLGLTGLAMIAVIMAAVALAFAVTR